MVLAFCKSSGQSRVPYGCQERGAFFCPALYCTPFETPQGVRVRVGVLGWGWGLGWVKFKARITSSGCETTQRMTSKAQKHPETPKTIPEESPKTRYNPPRARAPAPGKSPKRLVIPQNKHPQRGRGALPPSLLLEGAGGRGARIESMLNRRDPNHRTKKTVFGDTGSIVSKLPHKSRTSKPKRKLRGGATSASDLSDCHSRFHLAKL